MRIALVSGSWPPARCGVGDYTAALALALETACVSVQRLPRAGCPPVWAARRVAHEARREGAELLHIQYPAMGYGRSLFPAVLALASPVPVVVTLHEFGIFRAYRLGWFAPYAQAAHTIIFTSEQERARFRRRLPFGRARLELVPIGNNIGRGQAPARDMRAVCFFGLLMQGKNIEAYLEFAASLRATGGDWRLHLIGAVPDAHRAYAAGLVARARALDIQTHLELPDQAVADLLAGIGFAYLPFPGGADATRGSLLAALDNGVHVLAPLGQATPDWIADRVTDAPSAQAAVRLLQDMPALAMRAKAQTAAAHGCFGWEAIAQAHLRIYRAALQGGRR